MHCTGDERLIRHFSFSGSQRDTWDGLLDAERLRVIRLVGLFSIRGADRDHEMINHLFAHILACDFVERKTGETELEDEVPELEDWVWVEPLRLTHTPDACALGFLVV